MTDEPAPETYPSGIPLPTFDSGADAPRVIVLTGMAGAGRTRAAAAMSDLGWYVVDNLPPQMLASLIQMAANETRRKIAVVVDSRGGELFSDLEAAIDHLESRGVPIEVVFLDASDSVLVHRFEEARRPHPLQGEDTLLEGIQRERELVSNVRRRAAHVIDTSTTNVHELRERLTREVADEAPLLHVNVMSFGFKNGIPVDADFVTDVRFLHNPHWVPELRPLTGLDPAVRDHVLSSDGAREFLDGYATVLDGALTRYRAHDKPSVTIAVGCTGGKHRSVAMSEALGDALRSRGYQVRVTHRDRERG